MQRTSDQSATQHAPQTTGDPIAIVNSIDNQPALQTIMDHAENTMSEEASMSVGSVLIRLAKRYLGFSIDTQGQMHLDENKLNDYLAKLKKTVETHISEHETELNLEKEKTENEAPTHSNQIPSNDSENQSKKKKIDYGFLKSAWEYIRNRMNEEPNQLDQVTFFEDTQAFTVIIDIQTTLALVYAAITDIEIFKPDAMDSVKNQQERFYTLFMSFKRLQHDTKQRCHQGVRHDLVICNLSGTYPDAIIVSEPKRFLGDLISEAIFKLVEKIKMESGQAIYLDVIKECIMGEVHPELKKQLGDKSELRKAIHQAFRYVGLDPLNQKYEIEKYIRALNVVVTLPEGLITLGNQVHILLESNTKQPNELNSRVQFIEFMKTHWLKNQFSLANSEHQDTIRILSQVETAYAACRQYGKLFKSSKVNPQLSIDAFDSIYKQIDDYYQSALSKQAPIRVTEAFLSQLEKIGAELKSLAKDVDWISNIFAKWKIALDDHKAKRANDSLKRLIQLHEEMIDPDIQSHYLVNDEFLKETFKPQNENLELDLDYFNVNRLFLTAIVTAPKDWTPLFFEKMQETLQFLVKELNPGYKSSLSQNSKKFVRNSYPESLFIQLYQAIYQYKKIHALAFDQFDIESEKETEKEGLYIPTLHQVKDLKSAFEYFKFVPQSKQDLFSQYLKNHGICQSADKDKIKIEVEKFKKHVETHYSEESQRQLLKLLSYLHPDYLRSIIGVDFSILINSLKAIEQDLKFPMLNHLGVDYIKALATEKKFSEFSVSLFRAFSPTSRIDLLNWLGMDFIKNWASNDAIIYFIQIFPKNQTFDVLKSFGIDFFKKNYIYNRFAQITNFVGAVSEQSRIDFLNWLGMDFIKEIIPHDEMSYLIILFPENQRLDILKLFGIDFFKKNESYRSFSRIPDLFQAFPERSKIDLLNFFGLDFIKEITSHDKIPNFLRLFPYDQKLEILKLFGDEIKEYYLKVKPNELSTLMRVLGARYGKLEYPLEFLKYFGIDFIREFILKNGINHFSLINPISEKNTFFKALGANFLKTYFLKSNDLSLIHFVEESERFHLLLMLGFDTVNANSG